MTHTKFNIAFPPR